MEVNLPNVRLKVRGYGNGTLIFDERVNCTEEQLADIAESQIMRMAAYERNMLEIEFLDEPDPLQRFFRMGTDPSRMVIPIDIPLSEPGGAN